jgi:cytochrome c biogenesis protein CcdA
MVSLLAAETKSPMFRASFVHGSNSRIAPTNWMADRFAATTYGLALIGAVAGLLALGAAPYLTIVIGAILCGWVEVTGACGTSHICTLTPMRVMDETHDVWRKAITAYTVGGIVSAAIAGASLGAFGELLSMTQRPLMYVAIVVVSFALMARELGWPHVELPQVHRQTIKMWSFEYGIVTGAAMWGFHIGLGMATVIAHGGLFVIIAIALASGPWLGAGYMVLFWLGRTLPIWLAPALVDNPADGSAVGAAVNGNLSAHRHAAVVGLLLCAASAVALAL